METQDYNRNVEQLLFDNPENELNVVDDITELLLQPSNNNAGCKVEFVGSYNRRSETSEWVEYRVLYKVSKYKDTADYLPNAIGYLRDSVEVLKKLNCSNAGIQEVYCLDPLSYYVLLYIIK